MPCIYHLHLSINPIKILLYDENSMSFILNVLVKSANIESSQSQQPVLSEYRSITNEFQEEELHHDVAVS